MGFHTGMTSRSSVRMIRKSIPIRTERFRAIPFYCWHDSWCITSCIVDEVLDPSIVEGYPLPIIAVRSCGDISVGLLIPKCSGCRKKVEVVQLRDIINDQCLNKPQISRTWKRNDLLILQALANKLELQGQNLESLKARICQCLPGAVNNDVPPRLNVLPQLTSHQSKTCLRFMLGELNSLQQNQIHIVWSL